MPNNTYSALPAEKQAEIVFRFLHLYKSNPKGQGFGRGIGVRFDAAKNKCEYEKGSIGWIREKPKGEDWRAHLSGERALGLGPNLDDGMCWWACIDVDRVGGPEGYNFNVNEIVKLSAQLKLPLVPDFSKSGGLHLKVFFNEAVESYLVVEFLKSCEARLGCAGNEIFPKQTGELCGPDDFPSWIFMPYGPTWGDQFAEQCGINANGGMMEIEEYLDYCDRAKISRTDLVALTDRTNNISGRQGPSPNTTRQTGTWAELATSTETIRETFKSGPPCLFSIALTGCSLNRNIWLFNVAVFLRRKYSENWKEALKWVNMNICRPPLSTEEVEGIVKNQYKDYQYQCDKAPLSDFCNSSACRLMPYGVGAMGKDETWTEWGVVRLLSDPIKFCVNMKKHRVWLDGADLLNQKRFRTLWVDHTGDSPPSILKTKEWEVLVAKNLDMATDIEPNPNQAPDAYEIGVLTEYFRLYIPHGIRTGGKEYLEGRMGDNVRIRVQERRIYYKDSKLQTFLRDVYSMREMEIKNFLMFLNVKIQAEWHDRMYSLGTFFRSSYSVPFSLISEITGWLHPEEEDIKEE